MGWMETYLNQPNVKSRELAHIFGRVTLSDHLELGAPEHVKFQSCNMDINQKLSVPFVHGYSADDMRSLLQGDMHNAGALLPELVDSGVRVLIYAGQADSRELSPAFRQASDLIYPMQWLMLSVALESSKTSLHRTQPSILRPR